MVAIWRHVMVCAVDSPCGLDTSTCEDHERRRLVRPFRCEPVALHLLFDREDLGLDEQRLPVTGR